MDDQAEEQAISTPGDDVGEAARVLELQKAALDRLRAAFLASGRVDLPGPG